MIHASANDRPTMAAAIVSPTFQRPLLSVRVRNAKKVETIPVYRSM